MLKKFQLTIPVLFLVFNRPNSTKKVFEEIKKAKPPKLFLASDGPRENKPGEKEIVESIRQNLLKEVNWKCEVKTLFRDKNLGCKSSVSGAIDWFFDNVECGIILEDDCLPSKSFFRFCQELLIKYKDNEKIMQISGTNIEGISNVNKSYFAAPCFNAWGWATWKRAWKHYDIHMKKWKKLRFSKEFFRITEKHSLIKRLKTWRIYQFTYKNKIDTWDYQWIFSCLIMDGLCLIPQKNLITNLGFLRGTHTTNYKEKEKTIHKHELEFPLLENNLEKRKEYLIRALKFF